MNHTRWSSFSAAIILSTLSLMPASQAKDLPVTVSPLVQGGSPNDSSFLEAARSPEKADLLTVPSADSSTPKEESTLKVGAIQSQSSREADENLVARVVSHKYNAYRAATLYVRDIPVLTFLDPSGQPVYPEGRRDSASVPAQPKAEESRKTGSSASNSGEDATDPTWKAARAASTINELARQSSDDEINAHWDTDRRSYIITQGKTEIAAVNAYNILPDTTRNWDTDALQVTNRLRRLLTQSAPLKQLESSRSNSLGQSAATQTAMVSASSLKGWASWYGPGFHGGYSANGEVFDSRAMTAAHVSLPFGTQVRVTNLDNGRSVVVRISDRGPYAGGRILDVSEAAASALGMISSGVAPVRVDVLP